MSFMIEQLNEQLNGYNQQLNQAQVLVQQLTGAKHAIEHQLKLMHERKIAEDTAIMDTANEQEMLAE